MAPTKPADRYLPRVHRWYRRDAETLIAELQAKVWPLNFHIAFGGGVLNHGYSDSDLDLYVLPIFRREPHDYSKLLWELAAVMGDYEPLGRPGYPVENASFKHQVIFTYQEKRVDVFIVNAFDVEKAA